MPRAPIVPRGNRAAVTEVWADLAVPVTQVAKRFIRRYGLAQDRDREQVYYDVVSLARELALAAYHTYDPTRSPGTSPAAPGRYSSARSGLERRVRYRVWFGLLDWLRAGLESARRMPTASESVLGRGRRWASGADHFSGPGRAGFKLRNLPDPRCPEPSDAIYDADGVRAGLGADARAVLELLFGGELDAGIRAASPGPASVRAGLRAHLAGARGWAGARIAAAFAEIGEALE